MGGFESVARVPRATAKAFGCVQSDTAESTPNLRAEVAVAPLDSLHDGPRERDDGVDFVHELLVKWAVCAPSRRSFRDSGKPCVEVERRRWQEKCAVSACTAHEPLTPMPSQFVDTVAVRRYRRSSSIPSQFVDTVAVRRYRRSSSIPSQFVATVVVRRYRRSSSIPSQFVHTVAVRRYRRSSSIPSQFVDTVAVRRYRRSSSIPSQFGDTVAVRRYRLSSSIPSQFVDTVAVRRYRRSSSIPSQFVDTVAVRRYRRSSSIPSRKPSRQWPVPRRSRHQAESLHAGCVSPLWCLGTPTLAPALETLAPRWRCSWRAHRGSASRRTRA